jgi:hypothetical protein
MIGSLRAPLCCRPARGRLARLPRVATGRRCRHAEVIVLSPSEPTLIASAGPVGLHVLAPEFPQGSV